MYVDKERFNRSRIHAHGREDLLQILFDFYCFGNPPCIYRAPDCTASWLRCEYSLSWWPHMSCLFIAVFRFVSISEKLSWNQIRGKPKGKRPLCRPRCIWQVLKCNVSCRRACTGLILHRMGTSGGLLWTRYCLQSEYSQTQQFYDRSVPFRLYILLLTHCGRVTQICVFNTVKLGTAASSP